MESHQPWYERHHAILWLGLFLFLQWGCWRFLPDPASIWELEDVKAELRTVSRPEVIILDFDTTKHALMEPIKDPRSSQLTISTIGGVQYVKLSITTEGINTTPQWVLQYTTNHVPYFDGDIIHSQSLRPLINNIENSTELTWQLPVAAKSFRIIIPKASKFAVQSLRLAGIYPLQSLWHTWRQALVIFCFALNASLFLIWLAQYFRLLQRLCKQPIFIGSLILGLHGILMIWLLPPFQGADENRHWKQAMQLYRGDGQPGSVLYRLPVILDAESPRWFAESPFHAANLHAMTTIPRDRAENKGVGYVQHWGYPIVWLVSLIFPPVHTLNEALIFYYSCRVAALLTLIGFVAAAWRMGLGSWTLVVFLSFPLVLQQCVVVSTDTMLNLGTLLAVLLFRRHQLTRSTASLIALALVCCLVVAAKPPIYLPILVLPAWFIPWSKCQRPVVWILALLTLIALVIGGFFYLWRIVDSEGMGLGEQARKQLNYVLTGPGFVQFFNAAIEYPSRFLHPEYWWGPLGWLDTNLTEVHKALLWITLIGALLLDPIRWIAWLRKAKLSSLWSMLVPVVLCVFNVFFVWWSLALVMYLTITDYQSSGIVGMQVRYMVPVVLLFLTWPAARFPQSAEPTRNNYTWPIILLLLLAVARATLLAGDLQFRYWE